MIIYNYSNKNWEPFDGDVHVRGIISIGDFIEYGYFELTLYSIPIYYKESVYFLLDYRTYTGPLFFRNDIGIYCLEKAYANNLIRVSRLYWYYPIPKCYNFSKLNIQKSKVQLELDEYKSISNYTIGIEYETAGGNIPWLECMKYNLVPLYDGSITGHEYVTFPLTHGELHSIKEHLQLLDKYTAFDKNCSLHIHFGGFPINYQVIEKLVKIWAYFQYNLLKYIPVWSYEVEKYKDNHKAYNKPLKISDLKSFYEFTTANDYVDDNSFYLPNLFDQDEVRKWEVQGRYHNMNIMHLISGSEHKTVEFRFLRPTYNYNELKWYILILGSFLNYVLTEKSSYKITVPELIDMYFTGDDKEYMMHVSQVLYNLHKIQVTNNDCSGTIQHLKNEYLKLI